MLMTSGSLFAGSGALDLAVAAVFGATPIWFVENDPAAAKVLAHHWPNVPNLGDITVIEWETVDRPHILTGGFPCTDVSTAGRRAGIRPDTRSGLWSHMAYAIGILRPELVVIENVRGLTSATADCDLEPCPWCVGDATGSPLRALGAVLGGLADVGYDAEWVGLRASDVGAPHGRFRVFITARAAPYPVSEASALGPGLRRNEPAGFRGERPHHDGGPPATDTNSVGAGQSPRRGAATSPTGPSDGPWWWRESGPLISSSTLADAAGDGWREGRPGPAGQLRRPNAALRGQEPATDPGGEGRGPGEGPHPRTGPPTVRNGASTAPDPDHVRPYREADHPCGREPDPPRRDYRDTSDGASADSAADWGIYEPAIRRWERILGRPAPDPTITGKRGGQQLSPAFVEWLMGWPPGWVTAVPNLTRNDQLRICGNGVVPQQAVAALRYLHHLSEGLKHDITI
jgi:DNA (cytosine-5)-methyltransferase 1